MDSVKVEPVTGCHVVAMPYPGRGRINPMMNLCKILASRNEQIIITFVVTEEWLGFIGSDSDSKPANIRFRSIPNVVPSELVRAADINGFMEAAVTKMEAPFEQLLYQLGLNVKGEVGENALIESDKLAKLVQRFMNLENGEGKEMRRRARELQKITQQAFADDESSATNINEFIKNISRQCSNN